MASIKDVAKLAGVSVMTVSRTLNNRELVSLKTQRLVMNAVKTLGYEPNILGRNLRVRTNKTVLVAGTNFVDAMLRGIHTAANQMGYEVILMHMDMYDKKEYVRRIENGLASGILFMNMLDEQTLVEIGQKYPMVQCSIYADIPSSCSVAIDEEKAAYALTELLIGQGCRRIALISHSFAGQVSHISASRKQGFLNAMAKHGLEVSGELMMDCASQPFDYGPAGETAGKIVGMESFARPDAVLCGHYVIAAACLLAFREAGLSVPGDIAVASLIDNPLNTIVTPAITAVVRPYQAMGMEAMRLLAGKIEGTLQEGKQVLFQHELVLRDSTGKL